MCLVSLLVTVRPGGGGSRLVNGQLTTFSS
jgi:hypothetical protein